MRIPLLRKLLVFVAFTGNPILSWPLFATTPTEHITVTEQTHYRGAVADRARPQAITVLGHQQFADLGITRLQDALDNSATLHRENDNGGLWDSFSIRGFPSNADMPSNYLLNGFSAGRGFSGRRDVSNIDYIEILKGPGSALYGHSEPGGIINIVTKKPQYEPAGSIKAKLGSYHQQRLSGDYTSALSDHIAGRINGAWENNHSFRDHVFRRHQVISPSLK